MIINEAGYGLVLFCLVVSVGGLLWSLVDLFMDATEEEDRY